MERRELKARSSTAMMFKATHDDSTGLCRPACLPYDMRASGSRGFDRHGVAPNLSMYSAMKIICLSLPGVTDDPSMLLMLTVSLERYRLWITIVVFPSRRCAYRHELASGRGEQIAQFPGEAETELPDEKADTGIRR